MNSNEKISQLENCRVSYLYSIMPIYIVTIFPQKMAIHSTTEGFLIKNSEKIDIQVGSQSTQI